MNRYRLLIKSGWSFSGIGWSFSDLGWSFSVSTRPKKYKNADQPLVVRARHRSGFGTVSVKLPRFPADSPNEAMPWMGYGNSDGEEIYPGCPDENAVVVHHDERVCDNCGRGRGTVRAREGPSFFSPIKHKAYGAWWRANFEPYPCDGEPENKRRCLADNQKRLEELRAMHEKDQKLVDDCQADLYVFAPFILG